MKTPFTSEQFFAVFKHYNDSVYPAQAILNLIAFITVYYIFKPRAISNKLPYPTTIFTFGVLLLTDKKCPVVMLIIPFLWSLIGFTAAFNFGVVEDTGLIIAGILSTILLLMKNRKSKTQLSTL